MNIDDILKNPDFSLDEINIENYLDTLSFATREEALRGILNKLNPLGEITLGGIDLGTLAKLIANNMIDVPNANNILESIKSMAMLNDVERFFYSNNFKITSKNIEAYGKYILTAKHSM